jgi:hypothetical protein
MTNQTVNQVKPEARTESDSDGSLHGVVRPLPDYIQKHLAEIEARDKKIGFEADPLVSRHMAWRRWGKAKTNQELHELLMALRNYLYTADDCEGGIILEECAWRIWRPNNALSKPHEDKPQAKP